MRKCLRTKGAWQGEYLYAIPGENSVVTFQRRNRHALAYTRMSFGAGMGQSF